MMEFQKKMVGESLVLFVEGRLDVVSSPGFMEKLISEINSSNSPQHIVLDFAKLSYLSSAGIRVLLIAQKESCRQKKLLSLCNVSDNIKELLDLVGILNILPLQEPPSTKS